MRSLLFRLSSVAALLAVVLTPASPAGADRRAAPAVTFSEQVVTSPTHGGGYPGAHPAPGRCRDGRYDSNFAEGALALRAGTEQLVGGSKAFFGRWSTYKASHTVSLTGLGTDPQTHFVGGYDCVTTGTQAMPPSWTNVTDPNLAFDPSGRIHQLVLAYNAYWGSVEEPNGDVYAVYSDDGGATWKPGNGGKAVEAGPDPSVDSSTYLDKPWITANQNPGDPLAGHVYGAWVLFTDTGAEIHTAVSRDGGATWSRARKVSTPVPLGPSNPWPMIAVGPGGEVYLSYVSYGAAGDGATGRPATIWSARSDDDGRTWTSTHPVTTTRVLATSTLPGTTLHRTIVQYLAVSPDEPGHLYVAWNTVRQRQVDVMVSSSHDGGATWSPPRLVNDDGGRQHQFSATVAAGPRGAVVVGFYDQRRRCPSDDPAVLPRDRGRAGTCIGLTLQPYRDGVAGLTPTSGNVLASRHLWDPYQPGGERGGLSQLPCEDPMAECDDIFLGDYFSMQVSDTRVYALSASTHPESGVLDDDGQPLHYQQQLLTTLQRSALGLD